jgi:hypothetical protein
MSLGYKEGGKELTQANLDLGWRLFKDEQPERNRHIIVADWYDGPIYQIWYIDKDGKFYENSFSAPTEFTDESLENYAWIYMPEFNWG